MGSPSSAACTFSTWSTATPPGDRPQRRPVVFDGLPNEIDERFKEIYGKEAGACRL